MDSLLLNGPILHCLLWVTRGVFEIPRDLRSMTRVTCAEVISLHVCQYNFSHIGKIHDQGAYEMTNTFQHVYTVWKLDTFLSFTIHGKCKLYSFRVRLMHGDETGTAPCPHTAKLFLVCQRHR